MNLSEYTYLLNHPDAVTVRDTEELDKIVTEFPYFQSARALRLKGLYKEDSFRYNYALKVTAAYTSDRGVLFDFITSNKFQSVSRAIFENKQQELLELPVNENNEIQELIVESLADPSDAADAFNVEVAENTVTFLSDPATLSILDSIREATVDYTIVNPQTHVESDIKEDVFVLKASENIEDPKANIEDLAVSADKKLQIGKPLDFSQSEKHSFQEWLQLSAFHPIDRDEESEKPVSDPFISEAEPNVDRQKKNKLIDRFIQNNPKLTPIKKDASVPALNVEPSRAADNSYLMTETLARVYLEQKKYDKAIQAYEILILKYPEKSSFFADRILDIRTLKNTNN